MKYAADFRQEARAALQGKWPLAILVGLVAAILGGATSGGPEFKINFTGGSLNANVQYAGQTIYSWGDGITPGLRAVLVGGAIYLILAAIVLGVLYFILGSVIEVGYARFNLNLTAGEKPPFETLFSYFPNWKTVAMARLLQTVYILLWTLLLVIPGIVAGYSYAMTDYILAEHPELTAGEAIAQSKATAVSHHHHHQGNGMYHTHTATSYYATFQVESGDRIEFLVSGTEYGMLAEGDSGELTFQGTRYLNFQRNESAE